VSGQTRILGLYVVKAGVTLRPSFSVPGFVRSILKNPIEKIVGSVLVLSKVTSIISDKQFESSISVCMCMKNVSC